MSRDDDELSTSEAYLRRMRAGDDEPQTSPDDEPAVHLGDQPRRPQRDRRGPRSEEVVWKGNPCWRGMLARYYLKAWLVGLVLSALAYISYHYGQVEQPTFIVGLLVIWIGIWGIGRLIQKTTSYEVTSVRVSTRYGILVRRGEEAYLRRVQNISVDQRLYERLLRVGVLNFDTAGERHQDMLRFWGISNPWAVQRKVTLSSDLEGWGDPY